MVRLVAAVAGLVSIVVAFVDRIPMDIPAYAFGDAAVLRGERSLALLAILFVAFVVLWRGMVDGELPIEISQEGFKYQQREAASETVATLKELERSVEEQGRSIRQLATAVDRILDVVKSHGSRLSRLEAASKEVSRDEVTPA